MARNNDIDYDGNEQTTSESNRRSFIRRAGAVGTGLALSPVAAGNVAAEDISILNSNEKTKIAKRLAQTDEFARLESKAKSRNGIVSRNRSVTVGEVEIDAKNTPDGEKIHRRVVEYPVKNSEANTEASVVLAEDATSDSLILSVLDYTYKTKDGFTTRIERFDASVGEQTDSATSSSDGLTSTEFELDANATRRAVNNIDQLGIIGAVYDGLSAGKSLGEVSWDLMDDDVDVDTAVTPADSVLGSSAASAARQPARSFVA